MLGAPFNQIGTPDVPFLAMSEAKRRYTARDLDYWASHWEVPFKVTSRFPMRTVTALRLALIAGDKIASVSHDLFRALWGDEFWGQDRLDFVEKALGGWRPRMG